MMSSAVFEHGSRRKLAQVFGSRYRLTDPCTPKQRLVVVKLDGKGESGYAYAVVRRGYRHRNDDGIFVPAVWAAAVLEHTPQVCDDSAHVV